MLCGKDNKKTRTNQNNMIDNLTKQLSDQKEKLDESIKTNEDLRKQLDNKNNDTQATE